LKEPSTMRKAAFTYGLLDERLRNLGFTARTQKGKARIYRHEQTGASVILPDAPFDEEVLPHHLVVARHVLKEHNLGEIDQGQVFPNKTSKNYPPK
jgi:predicted RNA binding protein YcfA (HicA-like mRNA interferase family)